MGNGAELLLSGMRYAVRGTGCGESGAGCGAYGLEDVQNKQKRILQGYFRLSIKALILANITGSFDTKI
jgi:hypothetical protein